MKETEVLREIYRVLSKLPQLYVDFNVHGVEDLTAAAVLKRLREMFPDLRAVPSQAGNTEWIEVTIPQFPNFEIHLFL